MTDKIEISEIKEALCEYERERSWRRSVEAVFLLFLVVPVTVLAVLFLVGAFG